MVCIEKLFVRDLALAARAHLIELNKARASSAETKCVEQASISAALPEVNILELKEFSESLANGPSLRARPDFRGALTALQDSLERIDDVELRTICTSCVEHVDIIFRPDNWALISSFLMLPRYLPSCKLVSCLF